MLKVTKSLSAGLRTLVIASAAEAPAEEKPGKDLRRFETLPPTDPSMGVPPSSSEGGVEAELSAAPEEPSALALQTAAYTAELLSHVERLKGRLTALEAINDEGARLQKALQQQEEELVIHESEDHLVLALQQYEQLQFALPRLMEIRKQEQKSYHY